MGEGGVYEDFCFLLQLFKLTKHVVLFELHVFWYVLFFLPLENGIGAFARSRRMWLGWVGGV